MRFQDYEITPAIYGAKPQNIDVKRRFVNFADCCQRKGETMDLGQPVRMQEFWRNPENALCVPMDQGNRADVIDKLRQRVHWSLWDSHKFDANVPASRENQYFAEGVGVGNKTKIETNMRGDGRLAQPKWFVIKEVASYFVPLPDANTTLQQMLILANNIILELYVNDKIEYETLSFDMPAGGGQRVTAEYDANVAPVNLDLMWNGVPDQRSIKYLNPPVILKPGENFYWNVYVDPTAWAAFVAAGATATLWMYIFMHGKMYRAVQ